MKKLDRQPLKYFFIESNNCTLSILINLKIVKYIYNYNNGKFVTIIDL